MREGSCDKAQLVTYLQQNAAKGRAWASTLGIQYADISTYVDTLTAVTLRSDTRITNHGYSNGVATEIQVVLQAGTAVLVDEYGFPVTKCYCGNPLTAPREYPKVYYGPKWPAFTPQSITVVIKTTVIIDTFVLIDSNTGEAFTRPRGSGGGQDAPTTPPSTTPPTTSTRRVDDVAADHAAAADVAAHPARVDRRGAGDRARCSQAGSAPATRSRPRSRTARARACRPSPRARPVRPHRTTNQRRSEPVFVWAVDRADPEVHTPERPRRGREQPLRDPELSVG